MADSEGPALIYDHGPPAADVCGHQHCFLPQLRGQALGHPPDTRIPYVAQSPRKTSPGRTDSPLHLGERGAVLER